MCSPNIFHHALTAPTDHSISASAVSVIRLVLLSNLNENDVTWNYADTAVWTAAELSITIIATSLPSLRPLVSHLVDSYRQSHLLQSSNLIRKLYMHQRRPTKSKLGPKIVQCPVEADGGAFGQYGFSKKCAHRIDIEGGRESITNDCMSGISKAPNMPTSSIELWDRRIHVHTSITIVEHIEWQHAIF